MRIALSADHAGYLLKNELAARLAPKIEQFRAAYPRITPKSHARSV